MKKLIITLTLSAALFSASAQTKPVSTPIVVTQQEATAITQNLSKGLQILHSMDISSKKRDSLDMYIGNVAQFIDDKNRAAFKIDTTKKDNPIKKP